MAQELALCSTGLCGCSLGSITNTWDTKDRSSPTAPERSMHSTLQPGSSCSQVGHQIRVRTVLLAAGEALAAQLQVLTCWPGMLPLQ